MANIQIYSQIFLFQAWNHNPYHHTNHPDHNQKSMSALLLRWVFWFYIISKCCLIHGTSLKRWRINRKIDVGYPLSNNFVKSTTCAQLFIRNCKIWQLLKYDGNIHLSSFNYHFSFKLLALFDCIIIENGSTILRKVSRQPLSRAYNVVRDSCLPYFLSHFSCSKSPATFLSNMDNEWCKELRRETF